MGRFRCRVFFSTNNHNGDAAMSKRYRIPPDFKLKRLNGPRVLAEKIDWSHKFLGTDSLTNRGTVGGEPLKVCVLDTGLGEHKDLEGAIYDAKDFTRSRSGVRDIHGHSTWCLGFIGARANEIGVRGIVPECQLLVGKVLGDDGSGGDRDIAAGLEWGASKGADVFSLSLGGGKMGEDIHGLIQELSQQGKLVFAAAGNDGGPVNWPAAFAECVAVGAVDQAGKLTKFSSRGPELDILAPGYEMLSLSPDGGYATMSGTSMATPCAAAIATSILGSYLYAGNREVRDPQRMTNLLRESGTNVGKYKLINPRKLIADMQTAEPESKLGPITLGGYSVWLGWKKLAGK